MDDLGGALAKLLSDKESLGTLMQLVGSVAGAVQSGKEPKQDDAGGMAQALKNLQETISSTSVDAGEEAGEETMSDDSAQDAQSVSAQTPDYSAAFSGIGKMLGSLGGLSGLSGLAGLAGLGGGQSVPGGKSDLLIALKPYLRPSRSSQIDRAVSMLSTAYAVRAAMKTLGGITGA